MAETTEMKMCACCKKIMPLEHFNKSTRASDGHQAYCKECQTEKERIRKAKKQGQVTVLSGELAKFRPVELIAELRRRGYRGELIYEQRIKV